MGNITNSNKVFRPAEVYRLIASVHNIKKRNFLRGCCVKFYISSHDAEAIRRNNSLHDIMIIGALLKGPHGLIDGASQNKKKTCSDLFTMTSFPPLDWKSEVCYTAGYLNSMAGNATELLDIVKAFIRIETMKSKEALEQLLDLSKKYGASNFLSYKLAYLKSTRELSTDLLVLVSQIEDEIGHRDNVGLHFSALENISSKLSLFVAAQKRISALVGKINGNFRKARSLSNFIPTPLDLNDVAGFLLRATESSLIDTIYAVLVIFNLTGEFGTVWQEFEKRLDPKFLTQLLVMIKFAMESEEDVILTEYYQAQNEGGDAALDLYRTSAAFLERPKFAVYRNKIDRVIGARLLAEVIGDTVYSVSEPINIKELLLEQNKTILAEAWPIPLDAFYRTFLFLIFVSNRVNMLTLSKENIKYIFENTMGLDTLVSEEEMRALYETSPAEAKSLVAVLVLALYRRKSIDPDIDFEFRAGFISHVVANFNGSIIRFIDYLLEDSPQVAVYIANSLDEVTLEKLYTLVTSPSEASKVRCEILRAVGKKLNRIEFEIEADAITTRTKLSGLQQYFDSSRIYVDSVLMKKWLDNNPTIAVEQYRSLYPRIEAQLSSSGGKSTTNENDVLIIHIIDTTEHLLMSQIFEDAFEQFCMHAEFGIHSYLGRRIRHNTLDGITTDTVDTVLRKSEYSVALSNVSMRRTVDSWLDAYKALIDKLRRDYLQFESNSSLFSATLDLGDPTTQENILLLSKSLRSAGGSELLNELIIAFCWRQIAPQLENAARFIRTKLLSDANALIDKYFFGHVSTIELQMKSELHEAINEVFKKIADWFQIPETGFASASVRDLCQIIYNEFHRENHVEFSGNALDNKYTGISVHRLYDCLAVLLKNAQMYSEENVPILVNVNAKSGVFNSALNVVAIDITSTVPENKYFESKERIFKAIELKECDVDMVTEGFTGIKKLKFITRISEGCHTIQCDADDNARTLKLGFSIHAESVIADISEDIVQ